MRILELDRKYCDKEYNGKFEKMINEKDGVIFDDYTVKRAFNFGNGKTDDLKSYINDNRNYCKYYDLDNMVYV